MPVRRNEDVTKLDVAVDNALTVDVVDGGGKLREPPKDALLVEFRRLDVKERTRSTIPGQHKIHHEIRSASHFVEIQVEDAHEVRVMKTSKYLAFGQELVFQDIDMPVLKRKCLQCIVNAELFVFNLIDSPHSTLSQKADYPVGTDSMSNSNGHFFERISPDSSIYGGMESRRPSFRAEQPQRRYCILYII